MRRIAHLSDLHFGAHEPAVVERLVDSLAERTPHVVVVSGDLTQRAKSAQFRQANAFLDRVEALGCATVVVPGNHDIPLYSVWRRFFSPLKRYRRIVAAGRRDAWRDEALAIVGLNTARSLTFKDGRLSVAQIEGINAAFAGVPEDAIRILVTHHPLVPLPGDAPGEIEDAVGRADMALTALRAAHVHLLLAGHHHDPRVEQRDTAGSASPSPDPKLLVVQAGTATSYRRRGTSNSYNLLTIAPGALTIAVISAGEDAGFACERVSSYTYMPGDDGGWSDASSP